MGCKGPTEHIQKRKYVSGSFSVLRHTTIYSLTCVGGRAFSVLTLFLQRPAPPTAPLHGNLYVYTRGGSNVVNRSSCAVI